MGSTRAIAARVAPPSDWEVLTISKDPAFLQSTESCLGSLKVPSRAVSDAGTATSLLAGAPEHFAVLWDYNSCRAADASLPDELAKTRKHALVTSLDRQGVIALFRRAPALDYVLGRNPATEAADLRDAVESFAAPEAFGLRRLLGPKAEIVELAVTDYGKKEAYLEEIQGYITRLGFPVYSKYMAIVAWELLMNAIFDAGVEAGEDPAPGGVLERTENIVLSDAYAVRLAYGHDGERFAVSVSDPFGSLTKKGVIDSMARCMDGGGAHMLDSGSLSGGAGAGLYLAIHLAHQLHFIVKPGVSTEAIAVCHLTKRKRDYMAVPKTLHFVML